MHKKVNTDKQKFFSDCEKTAGIPYKLSYCTKIILLYAGFTSFNLCSFTKKREICEKSAQKLYFCFLIWYNILYMP